MLFIISASIAIKKCNAILKALSNQQIFINCIVTNNAKKMTDLEDLKKSIKGKIYSDSSEKNNKMVTPNKNMNGYYGSKFNKYLHLRKSLEPLWLTNY